MGKRVNGIPAEYQRALRANMPQHWRLAYDVTMHTGWRISDVLGLPVDAIGKGGKVKMKAQKTGKEDAKTLPPSLVKRLKANAGQFWLFPSPYNGGLYPITRWAAWKAVKKQTAALGMERIGAHSWRKTYAQNLRRQGFKISEIQKLLQHEDRRTTLEYLIDDD